MVKAQPLAFTPRDTATSSTQLMVGTASIFFTLIRSRGQAALLPPQALVVRPARNRRPEASNLTRRFQSVGLDQRLAPAQRSARLPQQGQTTRRGQRSSLVVTPSAQFLRSVVRRRS